jgi:hypothetical protein
LGIDFDRPWHKLPKKQQEVMLYGAPEGRELTVHWDTEKIHGEIQMTWEGLVNTMMRRYRQTQSESQKKYYGSFMSSQPCGACQGRRLKPEVCHVRVGDRSIIDVTAMTIGEAHRFLTGMDAAGQRPSDRGGADQGDLRPTHLFGQRGIGLPVHGPLRTDALRRGGPAHPAGLPGGLGTDRRSLHSGRALHRSAPARQHQAVGRRCAICAISATP